jgi:integrase/recombinase XerD
MPELRIASTAPASHIESLVDDYFMACRARGLSRSTILSSYGYPIRKLFLPWCQRNGVTELSQLTSRTVNELSVSLAESASKDGRVLSKATVHSYTRGIRSFLRWCKKEGEGKAALPALPRLPRLLRDVLDRDEIDTLEAAAQTERDRLMIRILGDCGLRSYELCSLRMEQILRHHNQANLHIHGKGELDRFVPLPPVLLRRLERYIRSSRPRDAQREEIFISLRHGRSGDYEPLTPSGVLQLVKRAADRAGIEKRVYTHLLRHSFITNCLRAGMSPILVAKIVGHSSLRMIERIYSHMTNQDAYNAMMDMIATTDRRPSANPVRENRHPVAAAWS